jgi:ABC-type antimicrobial peptide transport system permease subunit
MFRSLLRDGAHQSSNDQLASTTNVIVAFFGFATVMAMTISFFALVSSTYVCVREQLREIGVLRAIGLSQWRLVSCVCACVCARIVCT